MQWGHDGTPKHNGATMGWDPIVHYRDLHAMGPRWDGFLSCAMGTAMQWGHDGTPKHNGATMGWDPIVRYGDCHAMGMQCDPTVQWGHNGMGPYCVLWGLPCNGDTMEPQNTMGTRWDPIVHYGDLHAMGIRWDPKAQWGHNGMGPYCALWGLPCNGAMMGPQNTMGPRWDGTLLCAMGTAMQWGHHGTPKCNEATMGWDPIVCYGGCHAMGTRRDPKTQWGHDGMGPN